ncbi:hypothetical protein VTH8203_02457 [Vibrio thalassae]|uniref:Uncharacterized protein n=1 Tax=Vibrio thalassae TaxID=1243014 RepID=A0A240ELH9_9VIBR|nr:hypothetical protein VTH8203_02457 [Vibrio thalassae]
MNRRRQYAVFTQNGIPELIKKKMYFLARELASQGVQE